MKPQANGVTGGGGAGAQCPLTFFIETTEICLGFAKVEISTGEKNCILHRGEKRAFRTGKKSGKVTLSLLKNVPLTPLPQAFY